MIGDSIYCFRYEIQKFKDLFQNRTISNNILEDQNLAYMF